MLSTDDTGYCDSEAMSTALSPTAGLRLRHPGARVVEAATTWTVACRCTRLRTQSRNHILLQLAATTCLLYSPLPPPPNLELSDVVVEEAADQYLQWINKALVVAHDIYIKGDRIVFIQVYLAHLFLQFLAPHTHKLASLHLIII